MTDLNKEIEKMEGGRGGGEEGRGGEGRGGEGRGEERRGEEGRGGREGCGRAGGQAGIIGNEEIDDAVEKREIDASM